MLPQKRKGKSCLTRGENQDKMLLYFIKRGAVFIKLWCFSVEVAARVDENQEEEQPFPKTKKTGALKKKKWVWFVFKCDAFLNTMCWDILKIVMLSV